MRAKWLQTKVLGLGAFQGSGYSLHSSVRTERASIFVAAADGEKGEPKWTKN